MTDKTIFIVEDDKDLIKINQEYLENLGYKVISADTLGQARFYLEDNTADLFILDVMLPDGNGWNFCEEIRGKINAPILFLTCRDEKKSIIKGYMMGCDDYMTKPYSLRVLGAHIQALLRRNDIFAEGIINIPPLRLDLLAGLATLEDKSVYLTQKEIQILACLALNMGHKVNGNEVIDRLNLGRANRSTNLATHISNIRRKLMLNNESVFEIIGTKDGAYVFSRIRYN